jgi:uroporphyrinogen-III synthase
VTSGLKDQLILNTRPRHQQAELTALLEQDGARVLSFPVIEIELTGDDDLRQELTRDIGQYDVLLFVSRNAVDGAFQFIEAARLLTGTTFGVIGKATRQALAALVENLDQCLLAGEPYNSEALLEAEALQQVAGKRVMIFRGQQGRNLLGDELVARGAQVDYCEVYRRELPHCDTSVFNRLVDDGFPTLAILTSNEGIHNLFELVDASAAERLCRIPWLLISERMRESALKLGHNAPVVIAQSASDEGIWQTICEWSDQR